MTQLALIPSQDLTRRPEPEELHADLTMLFTAFQTQERQNPEQVIATYVLALEEFSAAEIHAGIMKFIKGEWPGHDGKFVPSCAMVARAVRAASDEFKAAEIKRQQAAALQQSQDSRSESPQAPGATRPKSPQTQAVYRLLAVRGPKLLLLLGF